MMIVVCKRGYRHFILKKKKRKKKKKNTFSYKNKESEGIVTHESSHNNDVRDFKQYKIHNP